MIRDINACRAEAESRAKTRIAKRRAVRRLALTIVPACVIAAVIAAVSLPRLAPETKDSTGCDIALNLVSAEVSAPDGIYTVTDSGEAGRLYEAVAAIARSGSDCDESSAADASNDRLTAAFVTVDGDTLTYTLTGSTLHLPSGDRVALDNAQAERLKELLTNREG